MATRTITVKIPVPTLSAKDKSALKKAFDADIVRILKRPRMAGAAITNWGPSARGTGRKRPGKKKAAKKTAKKKR